MTPLLRLAVLFLSIPALGSVCLAQEAGNPPEGKAYKGFGYPWEHNRLGLQQKVPEPWTPVKVDAKTRTASIWGRRYTFHEAWALPERIVSQKIELLAEPVRLRTRFGGEPVRFDRRTPLSTGPKGESATQGFVLKSGNVRMETSMRLDFDGFQLYDMTVTPSGDEPGQLDELVLDIPLRGEVARYFSHYLYYDFDTQRINRGRLTDSAGAIDGRIARGFTNHFWVGDHRVGLELGFEDNRDWSVAEPERAIELIPTPKDGKPDAVILRVTFVDRPVAVTKDRPLRYRFSILVNPFKPMMKNWRTMIVDNMMRPPVGYDPDLWTFTTLRVGPDFFIPLKYVSSSIPPADPKRRAEYDRVRRILKQNGIRYIPYSSLMSMDAGIPELDKYAPRWLRDASADREKPGRGKRETVSLYNKSIRDYIVATFVRLIRTEGERALYFDWASTGKPVVNPRAGDESRMAPGTSYKPIFSVHKFHRRLYKATHAEAPGYLITQHHSKMPILFSCYSDMIYTGEALNVMFRQHGRRLLREGKLPKNHPPYLPDYSRVPDDFWMAVYHQGYGFNNIFMSNIVKKWNVAWMQKHPAQYARFTRMLLSRLVVLDVPLLRVRVHKPTFDRLMLAFQEHFGGLVDPIRFVHPLDAGEYLAAADTLPLKTGLYIRPDGRVALAVANWTDKDREATLRLDFDGVGLEGKIIEKAIDIEGGPAPKHTDKTLEVSVPANDYRVYLLK